MGRSGNGRLDNKIALITGGASGIGAASARKFVAEGANVMLTDINDEAGLALASELGNAAAYVHHDVRDPASWQDAVAATVDAFGGLNTLVNNAGVGGGPSIEEETLESWRALMAVNSDAVFLGCQAAIAVMKETGGSIINLSSIHGIRAASGAAAYSASKGAVRLLSKSVALYCAENGFQIRCNSVHPGYVRTPLLDDAFEATGEAEALFDMVLEKHPIGRLGKVEDVAFGLVYLASDEAAFVTGSELVIDGGYLL